MTDQLDFLTALGTSSRSSRFHTHISITCRNHLNYYLPTGPRAPIEMFERHRPQTLDPGIQIQLGSAHCGNLHESYEHDKVDSELKHVPWIRSAPPFGAFIEKWIPPTEGASGSGRSRKSTQELLQLWSNRVFCLLDNRTEKVDFGFYLEF